MLFIATVVSFSQTFYSVSEDTGAVQPVLVLSNPSSTDITVEVMDANISAFGMFEGMHTYDFMLSHTGGGVDYDSGPYTVTFPAGQTRASFDVPINDDNILEDDESFHLSIVNITTLFISRISASGRTQTTIIIMDNDSKYRCTIS